jgi:hypothetical protein
MHVEMGCRLMDYWNIPPVYRAIVAEHHSESFDQNNILLAIVRLVNFNSRRFNLSLHSHKTQVEDVLPEAMVLNLDDAYLERLQEVMVSSRTL